MSRGVIFTADFRAFLNGVLEVDVPQGYNRIQINQLMVGGNELFGRYGVWLEENKEKNVAVHTGGSLIVTQRSPVNKTYSKRPEKSCIAKIYCEGVDSQSNLLIATPIGSSVYLGMNGNPYKITNRTIRFYLTNEVDEIINHTGLIFQYTFI
ncbi:Hypothetical protein GLP15_2180 [Giardia lamblia P15]|uniref:Uncharacterized protein n=1 Tax=Giardia intestinalis (strain P15) TaxID=658858 RepID=E1F6W9_GIAIA|nr:Hypothetical protein GLP15_2180 [Giardia lamblia P15]